MRARGLKFADNLLRLCERESRPHAGAWIEIYTMQSS